MELITKRERIRSVPARWARAYAGRMDHPLYSGVTPRDTLKKLDALDLEAWSAADVDACIGNTSWTALTCSACAEDVRAVIVVEDADGPPTYLCRACLLVGLVMLENGERA